MKTIKLIELIIKIANNEEVPKKIKWDNTEYEFSYVSKNYISDYSDLFSDITGYSLNDEVEIIEEEPKPITKESIEALGYACGEIQKCFTKCFTNGWNKSLENKSLKENKEIEKLEKFDIQGLEVSGYSMTQAEYLLEEGIQDNRNKINELIDKVNSLEKE